MFIGCLTGADRVRTDISGWFRCYVCFDSSCSYQSRLLQAVFVRSLILHLPGQCLPSMLFHEGQFTKQGLSTCACCTASHLPITYYSCSQPGEHIELGLFTLQLAQPGHGTLCRKASPRERNLTRSCCKMLQSMLGKPCGTSML